MFATIDISTAQQSRYNATTYDAVRALTANQVAIRQPKGEKSERGRRETASRVSYVLRKTEGNVYDRDDEGEYATLFRGVPEM